MYNLRAYFKNSEGEFIVNDYLNDLNIIDLVSEKHQDLRKKVRELWVKNGEEDVSQTESHMLAMLEIKSMTIAETARKINISRQATHKCAQNLISNGYIKITPIEGNQRDKLIMLTEKGQNFCSNMLILKKKVEKHIEKNIGKKNLEKLKQCLKENWIDDL